MTVGQSPAYDFSVSDEQKAVFLVSVSDFSECDSCAGDWPTVTGCPVSNPGYNCENGLLSSKNSHSPASCCFKDDVLVWLAAVLWRRWNSQWVHTFRCHSLKWRDEWSRTQYKGSNICLPRSILFFPSKQLIKLRPKLWEIEKEIVREVAPGDKHYLRKSADRKAQISSLSWTNALAPSQKFSQARWDEQNWFGRAGLFEKIAF